MSACLGLFRVIVIRSEQSRKRLFDLKEISFSRKVSVWSHGGVCVFLRGVCVFLEEFRLTVMRV